MVNRIPAEDLSYSKPGEPIRAPVWNTFIQTAKEVAAFKDIHGMISPTGELNGVNTIGETIPKYSIFSINSTGQAFDLAEPTCEFAKYADDSKILLTNDSTEILDDVGYRVHVLSSKCFYRMSYTGTAPSTGDEVGPIEDAFTLSVEGQGFAVLTEPDTDLSLIWVWPLTAGSRNVRVGKLAGDLDHNDVGTVTLWKQEGASAPATRTPDTEDGINITGVTIIKDKFVKLTDVVSFNHPIIEPLELAPCP